jgi:Gram-negative bacterial TonB protein C-terminal
VRYKFFFGFVLFSLCVYLPASAQTGGDTDQPQIPQGGDFSINPNPEKVPSGILVKGAMPDASDSSTPIPEGGTVTEKVYNNSYFGFSYPLPADWRQKFAGPPPSDSGYYVLAQIEPAKSFTAPNRGSILISAQDLFFSLSPARNVIDLVEYKKSRLSSDYKLERQPDVVKIAGRPFIRMDYMSPVAELHWYVLTTEIRCHTVEFMLTSRDTAMLESLVQSMDKMQTLDQASTNAAGNSSPVCVRGYASGDNILQRVEPVFSAHKFNPVPVRITIDRNGKVKHVHVISAFPEQTKTIIDALLQWEFKPYKVNGQLVEVETGIMFGMPSQQMRKASGGKVSD